MSEPGILNNPIPFGKYYLLERVNVGGMAEIFRAKAFGVEGFERLLAVKKILPSIAEDDSFINMFIDEAKIAGQLNHPNIAQIFDLGKVDDSYFIALEFISGKDLKTSFERARRHGEKVSIPRICYIITKICEGLGYAHDKKDPQGNSLHIVHRDVSPQNILVSYEGEVKVIDFGIAKAQGKTSQTQVGVLKGKFSYMSPEQVRGLHVDHRSDIFSLGIVMYELLTLERVFLGESDFDTLEKIRKVEMSPPSLYNLDIPPELEEIVLKTLSKNPEDRYQSAHELAEALELFMRNQGYYYTHKDLAAYMKETFSADIEFENKKIDYYQNLNLQPIQAEAPARASTPVPHTPRGDLSWSDDELETQIFDRVIEEAVEEYIEEIDVSSIVYSEDVPQLGAVSHTNALDQELHLGGFSSTGDDPPTVEYNRWDVNLKARNPAPEIAAPRTPRAHQSTMPMSAIERRNGVPVTVPNYALPDSVPQQKQRSTTLYAGIGLLLTLVLGGAAIYMFAKPGSEALIVFETEPKSVQILINDQVIHDGPTPFDYKASAGAARLVIQQEGFEPYESSVELASGKTYKLNQALKPVSNEDTGITINTTPVGARIEIAGNAIDAPTPTTARKLSAGKQTVKISLEGYLDETREVDVEQGKITELAVQLRPKTVSLSLTSTPDRSDFVVVENDSNKQVASGKTPETVRDLDAQKTYRVTIERRSYDTWEQVFEPGTEVNAALSAKLERSAPEPVAAATTRSTSSPQPAAPRTPPKQPTKQVAATTAPTKATSPAPAKTEEPTGTGLLSIASRPAARIYINDKDTGLYTPQIDYKIKAGNHKIGLVNPDFGLNKTYYVDLKPGESKRVINR